MRLLSVRQPWAYLIVHGIKDIENRSWSTTYRGRLAIHASTGTPSRLPVPGVNLVEPIRALPRGVIVGVVDLIDCVRDHPSTWARPDAFHWVLTRPLVLTNPILCKGQVRLVRLPDKVSHALDAQLSDLSAEAGGMYSNDR